MTERAVGPIQPAHQQSADRKSVYTVAPIERPTKTSERGSVKLGFVTKVFSVTVVALALSYACKNAEDAKNHDGTPTPAIPAHRISPIDGSTVSENCLLYLDRLALVVDQKTLNSEGNLTDNEILGVLDTYGATQMGQLEQRTDNVEIKVPLENRLPLMDALKSLIGHGGIEEVTEVTTVSPAGCEDLPLVPAAQ